MKHRSAPCSLRPFFCSDPLSMPDGSGPLGYSTLKLWVCYMVLLAITPFSVLESTSLYFVMDSNYLLFYALCVHLNSFSRAHKAQSSTVRSSDREIKQFPFFPFFSCPCKNVPKVLRLHFIYLFLWVYLHTYTVTCLEVRQQVARVGSVLPRRS